MRGWLERERDGNVVEVFRLETAAWLGSGPESIAPILGRGVAPRQCVIVRMGDRWLLRDVGATRRGTLVGGVFVKEAALVPGDRIQVGESVFRFRRADLSEPALVPGGAEAQILQLPLCGARTPDLPRERDGAGPQNRTGTPRAGPAWRDRGH